MAAEAVSAPTPGMSVSALTDCVVLLSPPTQPPLDLVDLLVQRCQPVPLFTQRVDQDGRQALGNPFQYTWHGVVERGAALTHHFAILGE